MDAQKIDQEFQHYMEIYKADPELGKILSSVTFELLFNDEFLHANSKFKDMNDIIWRSGFGIVNLMEVENVNQDNWNAYIAKNTECATWHEFGKLAMINFMKIALDVYNNQPKEEMAPEEAK